MSLPGQTLVAEMDRCTLGTGMHFGSPGFATLVIPSLSNETLAASR